MVDPIQLILLIVIVILTVLLVVLGIQVFMILGDLRRTIHKANKVLDNANQLTDSVSGPLAGVSTLITGLRGGSFLTLVKMARMLLNHGKEETSARNHHKE